MTDDSTPADNEADEFNGADDAPDGVFDAEDALQTLQLENAELKDRLLRVAAEAENTKRRAEREANDARAYAIQKFSRDLLGVADNLGRALQAAPHDSADQAVKNFLLGIEMTEKELGQAFERNGLKKVEPAKGSKFDPHLHQAMMEQEDPELEPGSVSQTMQPGYELFGRIVRPAMVVVTPKRVAADGSAGGYPGAGGSAAGAAFDTKA
jgi:molecular chaperone GrpE